MFMGGAAHNDAALRPRGSRAAVSVKEAAGAHPGRPGLPSAGDGPDHHIHKPHAAITAPMTPATTHTVARLTTTSTSPAKPGGPAINRCAVRIGILEEVGGHLEPARSSSSRFARRTVLGRGRRFEVGQGEMFLIGQPGVVRASISLRSIRSA